METCYMCGGKTEDAVELIICRGKTVPEHVRKCVKCGEYTVHIDEYERVRKMLFPTFLERIKNFFARRVEVVELFKGKIL